MGALGHRDCRLVSRSELKDFTDKPLTISAGSLFENWSARLLYEYWRRWIHHLCWGNLIDLAVYWFDG